jgi:hypothetical protein
LEAEQGWKAMWDIAFDAIGGAQSQAPAHHRGDAAWHAPKGALSSDAGS